MHVVLIINLLLNCVMEHLHCLLTEEDHGDLGVHEGAFGTICVDKEILNCQD